MNNEYKYIIGIWIDIKNLETLEEKIYVSDIYDEGTHIKQEKGILIEEIYKLYDGVNRIEIELTTTNSKLIQACKDKNRQLINKELKKELLKYDFIRHYKREMLQEISYIALELEKRIYGEYLNE